MVKEGNALAPVINGAGYLKLMQEKLQRLIK